MTGWRLGWLLVPQELQRAVDCLTGNFTICPPALAQVAAVAAFTPESIAEADALLHHYAANRQLLLDGLSAVGIDKLAPTDGAFYVYADVSHVTTDSLSFCSKLLNDTGVAIAPGIDFDTRAVARSCGCHLQGRRMTSGRRCGESAPGWARTVVDPN